MKRKLLSLVTMIVATPTLFAQLNGTYTVNGGAAASATNYTNVASAVSDLMTGVRSDGGPVNGPGVSGNVVVRLAAGSGPYSEQITIGAIAGASPLSVVRITGGPTREEINFAGTTTNDRHVVKLNGASYVQLDSLTIVNNDATYGFGVHLQNSSDYNALTNSEITVSNTSTSSNFAGVVIAGLSATTAGDHGEYNLISNNQIHGGYYGISYTGTSSTVRAVQNIVTDNTLDEYYYYGMRCYNQQSTVISGNTMMERINGSTSGYGIYNYYSDGYTIEKNHIQRFGTYGIYCGYNNTLGGTGMIANNFIGGTNLTTGTPYGIYLTTSSLNVNVYHNSISLTSGNGRCIYILSGSGNNVVNNSLSVINSTTGYALYVSSAAYVSNVNYNNYYVPGSSNFVYIASAYTPATFVGGGGFNMNSINLNPGYTDPISDLHIGFKLMDAGTNAGITEDFDGDLRPLAPTFSYDIGADEHTPDSVNVAVLDVIGWANNSCPDSNLYMGVVFANAGMNPIVNDPFTMEITGSSLYMQTINSLGSLPSGASDTIWFGPINTYPGGMINFMAYSSYLNDQDLDNDTISGSFNVQTLPDAPLAVNATVCEGSDVYATVVNDGYPHIWYDGNGAVISYADSLFIPSIMADSTVWAASANVSSGSLTTTFANNNSCGGGNMFKVTALNGSIFIDSFDLNSSAVSNLTVSLYYMAGDYIGNETNAGAWTFWEDVIITSTGTGVPTPCVPTTSLEIPAGQAYSIYIYNPSTVYTTAAGDFSNSDILIADGTGLCGLYSGTNYPRTFNGTIHYRSVSCPSASTPVTITAVEQPVVDLGLDIDACGDVTIDGTTSGATDYQWSTGGTSAMETFSAPYSSDVVLTVSNAYCPSDADTVNVIANSLPVAALGNDVGFCAGSNAVLDPQNTTPGATYNWSTGATTSTITVNVAGTYSVEITDPATMCTNSDTIVVTQLVTPVAAFSSANTVGSTWQFTDGSTGPATSWAWDFGDTGTSTLQNPQHTYASAGTYTVTLTATNACGTNVYTSTITILGIDEENLLSLMVYPNPTNGLVYVKTSMTGTVFVQILDMNGRELYQSETDVKDGSAPIADISSFECGTYFVHIKMNDSVMQTRIVKH